MAAALRPDGTVSTVAVSSTRMLVRGGGGFSLGFTTTCVEEVGACGCCVVVVVVVDGGGGCAAGCCCVVVVVVCANAGSATQASASTISFDMDSSPMFAETVGAVAPSDNPQPRMRLPARPACGRLFQRRVFFRQRSSSCR